jgi:formiminoglutamate deiminase
VTSYWCEHAALPDGVVAPGVRVDVSDGHIREVTPGQPAQGAIRLTGLTIPGFANCHSHAFHRALRARTQQGRGSFWTWREQMYDLAQRLNPDTYFTLARAVYREMAVAGITSVGEFHYLHHRVEGSPYDDPNVFGTALIEAARDVGVRITLLDTCYLAAGIGIAPEGVQRRFSDGSADAWLTRVDALTSQAEQGIVVGAAAHSVRAVPRDALPVVAGWAQGRALPLHVHLSEQTAENDACQVAYGCSPTDLLADSGVLGPLTSAVHATHLSEQDIGRLGESSTTACFCPTTERDLGDGIGPAAALQAAGSPLTLGSDSHAVVDPFEEMRALELDERLSTRLRGHWSSPELLAAGTSTGHASLGFADAGRIAVGARADLVTLDLDSPRTAGGGARLETAVFAASPADVVQVICDGRVVARRGDHEDVGRELSAAIDKAWADS